MTWRCWTKRLSTRYHRYQSTKNNPELCFILVPHSTALEGFSTERKSENPWTTQQNTLVYTHRTLTNIIFTVFTSIRTIDTTRTILNSKICIQPLFCRINYHYDILYRFEGIHFIRGSIQVLYQSLVIAEEFSHFWHVV